MATMAKPHRPFANGRPGDASWEPADVEERGNGKRGAFQDALHVARQLPKRAQQGMREQPEATLAVVAGASFTLGVLLGSRVVRAVALAALPVIATQLIRGAPAERIQEYAARLVRNALGKEPIG